MKEASNNLQSTSDKNQYWLEKEVSILTLKNIHQNKHFVDDVSSAINTDNRVTKITECLSDHELCTGKYVDSLTGDFQLICRCKCHKTQKNR